MSVDAWERGYKRGAWNGLQLGFAMGLLFISLLQECR